MYYKILLTFLSIGAIGNIGIAFSQFNKHHNHIEEIKLKKNDKSIFY